jgi:hypothetical protein
VLAVSRFTVRVVLNADAEAVLIRMALISYGAVQSYRTRTQGGEGDGKPSGEAMPLHDTWALIFDGARDEDHMAELVVAARAELDGWIRRPMAPGTTETLEELSGRIVADGWGISADECSRAMRCTTTLVRRARLGAGRHPENGYSLPSRSRNPMTWAFKLDAAGLSLRQIEALTGVPKSTLHDRLSRPGRTPRSGGYTTRDGAHGRKSPYLT